MRIKEAILVLGIVSTVMISGCIKSEENKSLTPSETVERYFKAIKEGRAEEAVSYLSSHAINELEKQAGMEAVEAHRHKKMRETMKDFSIEIIREEIEGERANVVANGCYGSRCSEGTVTLIKEEDVWKIDVPWGKYKQEASIKPVNQILHEMFS